jgi:hypothetical protein
MSTKHCIDVCNHLLRGERSAVETYDLALRDIDKSATPPELADIRTDHVNALATLTENVRSMDGTPDLESEIWDTFAEASHDSAGSIDSRAALKALEAGEKDARRDYESALADEDVMSECKAMIRSKLLPLVDQHIATLIRLQTE